MTYPDLKSQILLMVQRYDQLIAQQAQQTVERNKPAHIQTIAQSLGMPLDGLDTAAHYIAMWEDPEEQLPPHICAKLVITRAGQTHELPYQQPIGALHAPDKHEHLFELCMLRAEAHYWLNGKMDDGILDRMKHLLAEAIEKRQA